MANCAYVQGMEPLLFHPVSDAGTSDLEEFFLQEESPFIPTTDEHQNEGFGANYTFPQPSELQSNIQGDIGDEDFALTSQEDQAWRFGQVPQDSVLATNTQENSGLPVYQGDTRSQYYHQQQAMEPAENLEWQKENEDAPVPVNCPPNPLPFQESRQIDILNQTEQQVESQQTNVLEFLEQLFRDAETAPVTGQHARNGAFVDDENSLKMLKNGKDLFNLPQDLDGLSGLQALDLPTDVIESYLMADGIATDGTDDILREERFFSEQTELKNCEQPVATMNRPLPVLPGSLKRARDEDKAFAEDCPSAKAKKNETSELNQPIINFVDASNLSAPVPAAPQPNEDRAPNENWPAEYLQRNQVSMQPPRSTNNRVEAYPCDEAAAQQVPYAAEDIPPMAMTNPDPPYAPPDLSTQFQQSETESDSALLMEGSLVDASPGMPLDFLQQFLADLPHAAPTPPPQNLTEQHVTQPHQSTPNDPEYPTIDLTIDNDELEISPPDTPVIPSQQARNTAFPFPLQPHPLQSDRLATLARREAAMNGQNVSYVQNPPVHLRQKALPNRPATLPRGQTGNRPACTASGKVRKNLNVPPTAQEKERGELEDRVKSFSSSFKFALQYYSMVKPLANSGFKLIRQDRMKCMDVRCLMQHMISALEKDARDVTWHLPECRFASLKKPCKNCVLLNGDCRGCQKCA